MATPAWVRRRRTSEHRDAIAIRADQVISALERMPNPEPEPEETWTPRRVMSFASEG